MVRNAEMADAGRICEIYNYYILNTSVTFEESPVMPREMEERIREVQRGHLWLVCEVEGEVAGYAYAKCWNPRAAYRYSVESTVYLDREYTGMSIGARLYEYLIGELKKRSIHSIIGGIALPNEASVRLHEKFGFEKVAQFREVGYKFDKWIDVGYWQLLLR